MPHYLLTYELAADYLQRRAQFREAHLSLAWSAAETGELLLGGAVGDPPESALLLFESAEAAERFAQSDPYVSNTLVTSYRVLPWATVVGRGAATPLRPQDVAPA